MNSQHTLDLDETLALFDDFEVTAADSGGPGCCFSTASSSSTAVGSRCPNATDDSFTSLLLQVSEGSEHVIEAAAGEKRAHRNAALQPQELPAHKQTRPQRKKRAATRAGKAAVPTPAAPTLAPAPAPTAKKPRKHSHIEIRKLREQIEALQARHTKLELFGSDRPNEMQMTTAAGGTIQLSVSVAVAEQYDRMKSSKQLEAADPAADSSMDTTVTATARPHSVWLDLAVEQYKHLQHSEAWNRKLRAAVSKQLKVANLMQSLLHMKVSPQELDLLLVSPHPPPVHMQIEFASPQEQQLAELYLSMDSQFHETDLICDDISASNYVKSVFSNSHTRNDEVRGPTFELTTNTPVADDFQLLGDAMWLRFSEKKGFPVVEKSPDSQRLRPLKRVPQLLALDDKRVRLTLSSKFGGEYQVNGVIAVGKFREAHRIVITISSAYTVSGIDLVFRESAWIVISEDVNAATHSTKLETRWKSPLGPPAPSAVSSLFQTFYRLHTEKRDPRSSTGSLPFTEPLGDKTKNIRELVMKALSDQLRQHMTQLQDSMLSEGGSVASNMKGVKCPLAECLA